MLAAAGVAVWFFVYYNNSEKVATDAFRNLVTADNVAVSVHAQAKDDSAFVQSLDANLIANRHLPVTFNADAVVNQGNRETNLSAFLGFDRDGVIYAGLSGLGDFLGLTDGVRQQATFLGEDAQTVISFIDNVEAETWRIDIPEIISELNLDAALSEAYTCAVDQIQHNSTADLITQAYTQHPFFQIKDAADNSLFHNSYDLTIDATNLTQFLNQVAQSSAATQAQTCFQNVTTDSIESEISQSNVEALVGELPPLNIKVDWLSHQLTNLSAGDDTFALAANFTYPEQVNFNPPAEYRPATELLDQFTDVVSIYLGGVTPVTTETTL